MESKYYTPELEEFHVGFEYEITPVSPENDFRKYIFPKCPRAGIEYPTASEINNIKNYIENNQVRVKYLDKEDIEGLGWRFEKKHPGLEELQFTRDLGGPLDDLMLDYDLESCYLRIAWYGDGDVTRFSGTIKNKSELKKLMQQLNIK